MQEGSTLPYKYIAIRMCIISMHVYAYVSLCTLIHCKCKLRTYVHRSEWLWRHLKPIHTIWPENHTQKVDSMSSVCDTNLTDTLPIHIRTYVLTNIHTHVHMYIYIYKYVYTYACKHTNLKYVILKHNKINNLLK